MGQLLFRRKLAAFTPPRNTVVLMGHSFVANNSTPDGTFGSLGVAPTATGSTYSKGIFERAMIRLNQPFTVLANLGISGQTSTQIAARFGAALALKPGYIYLQAFSNDPFNGVATATSIANGVAMIQQANAAGIVVLLGTDAPRAGLSTAGVKQLCTVFDYFKDYAVSNPGLIVVDNWPYFMDTSSYANSYNAAPLASTVLADNVHPNAYGAGLAAENAWVRALKDLIPVSPRRSSCNTDGSTNGDTNIINANPLLLQGTGGSFGAGASGTSAQGTWTQRNSGAITGVCSIVGRSTAAATFPGLFDDGIQGGLQKIALSASGGPTETFGYTVYPVAATIANLSGPWVCEAEIGVTMTSGTLAACYLTGSIAATTSYTFRANINADAGDYLNTTKFQGVLRTRPFYAPAAGVSQAALAHSVSVFLATSAAATGDVYIGNFSWRKVQA